MTAKRMIAGAELVLILPACLFMAALFARNLQPAQFEPAHTARQVVDWYAARPHVGLQVFLIAMPLVALLVGAGTVRARWRSEAELRRAAAEVMARARAHLATLVVAASTLVAAVVLGIVALHVLTD